jgi:hypothetical protein
VTFYQHLIVKLERPFLYPPYGCAAPFGPAMLITQGPISDGHSDA